MSMKDFYSKELLEGIQDIKLPPIPKTRYPTEPMIPAFKKIPLTIDCINEEIIQENLVKNIAAEMAKIMDGNLEKQFKVHGFDANFIRENRKDFNVIQNERVNRYTYQGKWLFDEIKEIVYEDASIKCVLKFIHNEK